MSKVREMWPFEDPFGLKEVPADMTFVGLECEIESVRDWSPSVSHRFHITEDGSLRNNGKEFISKPNLIADTVNLFEHLHTSIELGENPFSERTSIHVHVNCLNLEERHVLNIIRMYALYEELFFAMAEPSRRNNIHCVPLTETFLPAYYASNLSSLVSRWHKYTALNIKPLSKLGTIEFRHMHGHGDKDRLKQWLKTIEHLVRVSQGNNPNRDTINQQNIVGWYYDIFQDAPLVKDYRFQLEQATFNSSLDLKLAS